MAAFLKQKVSIKFSNNYSNDLLKIFIEMLQNEYTTPYPEAKNHSYNEYQTILKNTLNTRNKNEFSIPTMHIYYGDKLVRMSFPRKVQSDFDLQQFKISKLENYYKVGTFKILDKYSNMGIGYEAVKLFMQKYPKLVYTPEVNNIPSIKLAIKLGLHKSHDLYVNKDHHKTKTKLFYFKKQANLDLEHFMVYKN
jgi:RimJ/RimL family protein N-acetyltransferase